MKFEVADNDRMRRGMIGRQTSAGTPQHRPDRAALRQFVAAKSRQGIAVAQRILHPGGHGDQQLVAGVITRTCR